MDSPLTTLSELDGHLRRRFVTDKLTQFFRVVDARQLRNVDALYEKHATQPAVLFDHLLERYPRAPRDAFDEVKLTLHGLDEASHAQREQQKWMASSRAKQQRVTDLLRSGADLLSSPLPRSVVFQHDDDGGDDASSFGVGSRADESRSYRSGISYNFFGSTAGSSMHGGAGAGDVFDEEDEDALAASSEEHLRDLKTLRALIQSNRKLAADVSLAEQQVTQKRFEVLFRKLVVLQKEPPLSSVEIVCQIHDGSRVLQVPCTTAERQYLLAGPLTCPLSHNDLEHCTVIFKRTSVAAPATSSSLGSSLSSGLRPKPGFAVSGDNASAPSPATVEVEEPRKVIRALLSMAMRVWSRQKPHTVSEWISSTDPYDGSAVPAASSDDIVTHPSSTLWWLWPTPCLRHSGCTPMPLVTPIDDPLSGAALTSTWAVQASQREAPATAPEVHAALKGLMNKLPVNFRAPPVLATGDSASPNTTDAAYWVYFTQQLSELVRTSKVAESS